MYVLENPSVDFYVTVTLFFVGLPRYFWVDLNQTFSLEFLHTTGKNEANSTQISVNEFVNENTNLGYIRSKQLKPINYNKWGKIQTIIYSLSYS